MEKTEVTRNELFEIALIIYRRLSAQIAGADIDATVWQGALQVWRDNPAQAPLVEVALDCANEIIAYTKCSSTMFRK
jgi:hypothetical protein